MLEIIEFHKIDQYALDQYGDLFANNIKKTPRQITKRNLRRTAQESLENL